MSFKKIPRNGSQERRNLSPGLFEFLSSPHTGPHCTYPNALLCELDCRRTLTAQAKVVHHTHGDKEIRVDSNTLAAYDTGAEDRMVVDKAYIKTQSQDGDAADQEDVPKGTWWSRWAGKEGQGEEMSLMSVIDGHGGGHLADLAQMVLHSCIVWAISQDPEAVKGEDEAVMRAISDAYLSISQDLANAVLRAADKPEYTIDTKLAGMPSPAQLAVVQYENGGGACASTAILYKGKLYVAGLGDCRVVAVWNRQGEWCSQAMVQDHNGYNPAEVERIKEAHPDETVMYAKNNGSFHRLKDGLLPTRCIGDISFNRTEAEKDKLKTHVMAKAPVLKGDMQSPPYLEWTPEVVVHDATDLRFLILASDGVWDRMTSKEAALGTIAHGLSPMRAPIPWEGIDQEISLTIEAEVFPSTEMSGYEDGKWIFEDYNAGTFLLRNALCGGDRDFLREMMSLRNGTRVFRDDMTAMVVTIRDK